MRFNYPGINWNQRFGNKKTKLNICHHLLTSSTQLQNKFISRHRKNEKVFKMSKDEKCTCKACKNTVFRCQICKFVGFVLPSSSWLLGATGRTHCFCILNMETTVPFCRAISVRRLPFAVLSDNVFWNRCIQVNIWNILILLDLFMPCLLYTSPSPRDA